MMKGTKVVYNELNNDDVPCGEMGTVEKVHRKGGNVYGCDVKWDCKDISPCFVLSNDVKVIE